MSFTLLQGSEAGRVLVLGYCHSARRLSWGTWCLGKGMSSWALVTWLQIALTEVCGQWGSPCACPNLQNLEKLPHLKTGLCRCN